MQKEVGLGMKLEVIYLLQKHMYVKMLKVTRKEEILVNYWARERNQTGGSL